MTVTTQDLRAKMVRAEMLDLETRSFYLSNLWSDEGSALGIGQSLDIGEVTDTLAAADFVDTNFANQNLTVQTITYGNNNLVVDQARALSREIPTFDDIFTLGGQWVQKVSPKVLTKLKNDRDSKDINYLLQTVASTTGTAATYHINVAGAGISRGMIGKATAVIMQQEGIQASSLAWFLNPFAAESIKLLPTWHMNQESSASTNRIGLGMIGWLNGIPVYTSQTIPQVQTVSVTGVVVAGGNATFTLTPSTYLGNPFVTGMKIWSTRQVAGAGGWTVPSDIPQGTPLTIASTTATTIVVPYAGAGATDATVVIQLQNDTCPNMLVRRDWLFQATIAYRMGSRIIPYGRERISDVLQAWTIWGRKARTGSVYVVHTPNDVVSS